MPKPNRQGHKLSPHNSHGTKLGAVNFCRVDHAPTQGVKPCDPNFCILIQRIGRLLCGHTLPQGKGPKVNFSGPPVYAYDQGWPPISMVIHLGDRQISKGLNITQCKGPVQHPNFCDPYVCPNCLTLSDHILTLSDHIWHVFLCCFVA